MTVMFRMQETTEFFNLYLNMSFFDVSHYYAFIHELLQIEFFYNAQFGKIFFSIWLFCHHICA